MSTIRLAVAAIVDAHRRVGLESPQTTGVTETLRGLSRQLGVSQKQARPLDADALAAIRATALNPRKARGGSLEMEDTALRRGRLDIALASVLSDAGLRISEVASLIPTRLTYDTKEVTECPASQNEEPTPSQRQRVIREEPP